MSLNIKCGELTVASLMENSQSDSQELTGNLQPHCLIDEVVAKDFFF